MKTSKYVAFMNCQLMCMFISFSATAFRWFSNDAPGKGSKKSNNLGTVNKTVLKARKKFDECPPLTIFPQMKIQSKKADAVQTNASKTSKQKQEPLEDVTKNKEVYSY